MVGMVGFAQLWGIAFGTEAAPGTVHGIGIRNQEMANAETFPSSHDGMRLVLPMGPYGEPVSVQAHVQIATWNVVKQNVVERNVAKTLVVTGNGGLRGKTVIPI